MDPPGRRPDKPPTRPETSAGRSRGKRREILDAALSLLAAEGPEGFTASALAASAGVSKANLFHHFESLDDIVLASFEQYALGLEMARPPAGTGFREWLAGMADELDPGAASRSLTRAYMAFVARALFDERLRLRVLKTVEAGVDAFAAAVDATAGDLDHQDARELAALILMAADGLVMHLHAFPERRAQTLAAWALLIERLAPEATGAAT